MDFSLEGYDYDAFSPNLRNMFDVFVINSVLEVSIPCFAVKQKKQ